MGRPTARRAGALAVIVGALAVAGSMLVDSGPVAIPPGPPVPSAKYSKPLGAAVTFDPLRADRAYRDAFFSTFVSTTPENELKWEVMSPSRGRFLVDRADAVVDTAVAAGARVRGHPLVWDLQLPDWVKTAAGEDMREIVVGRVRRLVAHFRGRVSDWDVVNEPLEDDGSLTANAFTRALGEGYIDIAFEAARAADPGARLFLNEIAAERGAKADALVALAGRLRARGVPIDGIGLQNHTTADDFPTRAELSRLMRRLAALGLDVEITEMDVAIQQPGDDPLPAWRAAAEACAAAPNCTGLTVWGVTDARSWLGPERAATLFDHAGQAKPALRVVARILR